MQTARGLARASDAALVDGVVKRDEGALRELSHRHAAALSVLACAMVRQPAWARRAVAEVFDEVWADPDRLGARDASVRAQFAAMVHEHCRKMEQPARRHIDLRSRNAVLRTGESTRGRIAVALIAFGDHTCRQAAELVGTDTAVVAERLRAFVLDPDHFEAFCTKADNVVALRDARRRREAR
ncbi:MAG: hypothetical protein QOI55_2914 [Actinomycetota bacterium]|nr:hypothetical protein [Actinomycetota bacterium]